MRVFISFCMVAVFACAGKNDDKEEVAVEERLGEALEKDSAVIKSDNNENEIYKGSFISFEDSIAIAQAVIKAAERDSVEKILTPKIKEFTSYLRADDYRSASKMLHPEGLYYYTLGRVDPLRFNKATLQRQTGYLDGAYSYGMPDEFEGVSDSVVTGLHWLDSLSDNYTDKAPTWYAQYGAVGYGFTGNYSSNHINWDDFLGDPPDSLNIYVAYISHNSDEIDDRDLLMLEFYEDDQGDWKIYAIGNLEWTP